MGCNLCKGAGGTAVYYSIGSDYRTCIIILKGFDGGKCQRSGLSLALRLNQADSSHCLVCGSTLRFNEEYFCSKNHYDVWLVLNNQSNNKRRD